MDSGSELHVGHETYVLTTALGGGRFLSTRKRGTRRHFLISLANRSALSDRDLEERLQWSVYNRKLAELAGVESTAEHTLLIEQINTCIPVSYLPRPLDLAHALSIAEGLAEVLQSLHSSGKRGKPLGYFHPNSLFVDIDSGLLNLSSAAPRAHTLAFLEQPKPRLTVEFSESGSLLFIAPEVLAGGNPSKAGDVFSLACLLHWITASEGSSDMYSPPDPVRLRTALQPRNLPSDDPQLSVAKFLKQMLDTNPQSRPNLDECRHWLSDLREHLNRMTAARENMISSACDWVSPLRTETLARAALELDGIGLLQSERLNLALRTCHISQLQVLRLGLSWALEALGKPSIGGETGGFDSAAVSDALRLLTDAGDLLVQRTDPAPERLGSLAATSNNLFLASVRSGVEYNTDPRRVATHTVDAIIHWICLSWGLPPLCDVPGAPQNTECLLTDSELHWAQLHGEKSGPSGWAAKVGTFRTYENHGSVATGRMLYRALAGWLTELASKCVLYSVREPQDKGRLWQRLLQKTADAIG